MQRGTAAALAARYLHGPAVDQIMAQEDVGAGDVLWQLTDHLGSTRDLVESDGDVAAHYQFDSFGRLVDGLEDATRYLYTGREWEPATDYNYHRARWLDPATGKWLSEDPIGFAAGDANLTRYVGNGVVELAFDFHEGLAGWTVKTIGRNARLERHGNPPFVVVATTKLGSQTPHCRPWAGIVTIDSAKTYD